MPLSYQLYVKQYHNYSSTSIGLALNYPGRFIFQQTKKPNKETNESTGRKCFIFLLVNVVSVFIHFENTLYWRERPLFFDMSHIAVSISSVFIHFENTSYWRERPLFFDMSHIAVSISSVFIHFENTSYWRENPLPFNISNLAASITSVLILFENTWCWRERPLLFDFSHLAASIASGRFLRQFFKKKYFSDI